MAVGDRNDPYAAFNFLVEIDGITRAGFQTCSGLASSQEVVEYREGTDPLNTRKLPGLSDTDNVTLSRGVTDDAELWTWRKSVVDGQIERKNLSIVILDATGQEQVRWNLRDSWPTRWQGPSFDATGREVAIESLEIAHEGLEKA